MSSPVEVTTMLSQVDLFRGLDPAQLERLAAAVEPGTYQAGETVFRQDAPGDSMFIVEAGQVEVAVHDGSGEDHTMVYLGRGQVFGEMALVDGATRSATISAVEDDTRVYRLAGKTFTALCEQDTAIGYILMRNIAQDISFKLRHNQSDRSE